MANRIEYPAGCQSERAKRQYRAGLHWGRKDAARGKRFAVAGQYWTLRGYEDATKHIAGPAEFYEQRAPAAEIIHHQS